MLGGTSSWSVVVDDELSRWKGRKSKVVRIAPSDRINAVDRLSGVVYTGSDVPIDLTSF